MERGRAWTRRKGSKPEGFSEDLKTQREEGEAGMMGATSFAKREQAVKCDKVRQKEMPEHGKQA